MILANFYYHQIINWQSNSNNYEFIDKNQEYDKKNGRNNNENS